MSVEALAQVLNHSRAQGTAKLVLLGIANHAGDGGAWPTVATLARYANVTPRAVQLAIGKLCKLGELSVERQTGGLGYMKDWERPNRYEVLVRCPQTCDGSTNHRLRDFPQARQLELIVSDSAQSERVKPASPGEASDTPSGEASFTHNRPTNPAVAKSSTDVTVGRGRPKPADPAVRGGAIRAMREHLHQVNGVTP